LDESERVAFADRAKEIVESEVFKDAIERLVTAYTELSIEGKTVEFREEARIYVKLARALPNHFTAIILDGHVAQKKIEGWGTTDSWK
jgi:hypothetical protein